MPANIPTVIPNSPGSKSQSGAALLVFLLLIIVSASTLLLNRLNSGIKRSVYNPATSSALNEAKEALLSWAVNHPVNPGTLPMPDRNSDSNYDGDSDCYNGGPIGNNLLLGRIPWRDYPSPCKDSASLSGLGIYPGISADIGADRSGRVLWYAASHNLVYETPEYSFISPGLINKPADWITVRDSNGAILSDRVAFIVIAPGPVLSPYTNCNGLSYAGQSRSGNAPAITNYLDSVRIGGVTYSNADYDQDFIIYPNSVVTNEDTTLEQCDQFNDQLVFVTIDDLMDVVSKRVLNETANVLTAWYNVNDALPWLAPFADPKAEPKSLHGTATSSSNNLTDTSVNFTEWGVTAGDTVWNLTDGSNGVVATGGVTANTLTLNGALKFGFGNTFSVGDEYFVDVRYMSSILMETASGGSTGNTLEDSGRDFGMLGVTPGDIIENVSDGSSGIISAVDGDKIIAAGTGNDFSSGDTYRIRSNTSKITSNTANLILIDTNADFLAMGVQFGDIVHNLWDQAIGRVIAIDSANQLRVDTLKLGTGVVFNINEPYQISRYNSRNDTRIGLLPIHQQGEVFPTGFRVDWYSPNSGGSVTTTLATDTTYTTAVRNYAGASSGYSDTVTVSEANSKCVWISHEFVRCKGLYEDTNAAFLTGTTTTGSSSLALRDSTKNFTTLGTKRGDKIRNITDGTTGIVFNTSSTQLTLVNINGMTNVGIGVGDSYQIDLATSSFTFAAQAGTSTTMVYYNPATVNESLFQVNDTIENTTQNPLVTGPTSIGRITGVNTASNYINYSVLQGGGWIDVIPGEVVSIKHNFVNKRQYEFDVTMKGTSAEAPVSDVRTRRVCKGYDASCTTAANNATLKGDGTTAFVTIRDYEGVTEVGRASNTLPTSGLSSRSLNVSGLEFYLNDECRDNDNDCTDLDYDCGNVDDKCRDLPEWFVRNKWYQYVMVAYSNGDAPGGSVCTAGTNCLTVNMRNSSNAVIGARNNVRAMVMLARDELSGQSWANAAASDYFDNSGNTNLADEIFDRQPESDTFNDIIRVAVSCPTDTTKLCWSN